MFRRLAEAFQGTTLSQGNPHIEYVEEQEKYFKTLPHLIPSGFSGLPKFDEAIQTTEANTVVDYPNEIFRTVPSPTLAEKAAYCASTPIDDLIAVKNPRDPVGCGWLYSPPPLNSPYPVVNRGALGKADGAIRAFNPPASKQWFFDLAAAKKQVLLDTCKALKSCTDVDNPVYKGKCGFCKDTNQGVPIDGAGQPLYPSDPRGGCDSEAIVRSAGQCPPPPPPAPGPQPMVDRTCDPVNGRIGPECMRRQLLAAGCQEQGALAVALAGPRDPRHYLQGLSRYDALWMYQRRAQPALNLDLFRQGQATVQQALDEGRRLVANTYQPEASGLGLAARDLCLRRGAFQAYDACSELSDASTAPFDLRCLQHLFLKMGGQTNGKKYPSVANHAEYNAMGTWGAVKQYIQRLYRGMYANTPSGPLKESFQGSVAGGDKYTTQRQAMIDLLGIVPEKAIARVPYRQGVETFFFVVDPKWHEGKPAKVRGFLRRTVERDLVQLQPGPSRVAQIGGIPCGAIVQLTDIRAPQEGSVRFRVNIDDGFWLAVNQPHSVDRNAMNRVTADEPGLFANNWYQGPTWYESKSCTPFSPSLPNIAKFFFQDGGCGWNSFVVNPILCSGVQPFQKPYYSLTLEERAPFLAFEVNPKTGAFEERRLPAMFELFRHQRGPLTPYLRKDDRLGVPGKKPFLRMNCFHSCIDLYNIAYQSWKTVSFAIRFQSRPVKETLFGLAMGQPGTLYYNIIATAGGGDSVSISVEHFFGGRDAKASVCSGLQLNRWYLFFIINRGTGFDLYVNDMVDMVQSKGGYGQHGYLRLDHTGPLYAPNGTWHPTPGQNYNVATLTIGTNGFIGVWKSYYATSTFEFDLAWVHFFDFPVEYAKGDLYRECMGDWQYTQLPVAYQTFEALED